MPEAERQARLARLAEWTLNPDVFDAETLANLEQLSARPEPTDEERREALEWWRRVRSGSPRDRSWQDLRCLQGDLQIA